LRRTATILKRSWRIASSAIPNEQLGNRMSRSINSKQATARRRPRPRRGAIIVLFAVLLIAVLIFAAWMINLAYLHMVRTELRTATDAGVRAAGRTLSLTQSTSDALAAAQTAAAQNQVAGRPLQLAAANVEFGYNYRASADTRWTFEPNPSHGIINAVRITGKRTADSLSGPVPVFFPGMLGRSFVEPVKSAVAMQVDRDIALVVDRSGSMAQLLQGDNTGWASGDAAPVGCRWLLLAEAVEAFLDACENTPPAEQLALASFSSTATLDSGLDMNYSQVSSAIDQYSQAFPGGSTAIGDGINQGLQALLDSSRARPYAFRTIVVMTDGNHNTGTDPEMTAQLAQDTYGVSVHTITFSNQANQTKMQAVASLGGGQHWHAPDAESLIDAYVEIANNTPTILTE
jgi:Flp pilus assembly protein TadG